MQYRGTSNDISSVSNNKLNRERVVDLSNSKTFEKKTDTKISDKSAFEDIQKSFM